MILYSTVRVAFLLILVFCTGPLFAQDKPEASDNGFNPVAMGIAPESPNRHCFEPPDRAKDAIRRLSQSSRYWLAEDAIYIITPAERCTFLHLSNDEEREQFIEQFWYRRSVSPISLDFDFKTEFYRRIVVANQEYGSKLLAGRNTDRGRLYVIFGPPDSVDKNGDPASSHSMETWHYHYVKGVGENVQIQFEYDSTHSHDYVLRKEDRDLVGQTDPNPEWFPVTPESIGMHIHPERTPKIRFLDLEALLVCEMVRHDVKFSEQIKYSAATHATTLVRIDVQIPCETCDGDGQTPVEYPLFVRVSKRSGWVVSRSELVADIATHDRSDSKLTLTAHFEVPLAPGIYQLAIATKNATTGDAGVLRTEIKVPNYESLGTQN